MASYIIHDIAGEQFIKYLQLHKGYNIPKEQQNIFLMGNLIPDSSKLHFPNLAPTLTKEELFTEKRKRSTLIQQEKQKTHFRDISDIDKTIQVPDIEQFLNKYSHLLSSDISVLGYLFHLYTDKLFFGELLNNAITFYDINGNITDTIAHAKTIKLSKNNQIKEVPEVFSYDTKDSIYTDYTKMNLILLTKYQIEFPLQTLLSSTELFHNPGIEEVDYTNINNVLIKTARFIEDSKKLTDTTLRVFDESAVTDFINRVVETFINLYQEQISKSMLPDTPSHVIKKIPKTNGEH